MEHLLFLTDSDTDYAAAPEVGNLSVLQTQRIPHSLCLTGKAAVYRGFQMGGMR